ncbi:hypothetical protein M3936_04980 [Sutcliffiella horikoshii]|uniref:hypothetical protein n=1 Tax=Sutcliffiella horikoshii TaxID=79883 RepID=UPI002040C6D1|nr:hypothetical protein [Sutcliffiella horikoshii]MCM3616935.1 hypothetical protein [Sutcliffiella horikoshii]
MIEFIKIMIFMLIATQGAYFILVFFLYSWAMEWYEWGTFKNPDNLFKKVVNIWTMSIFGIAYWVGLKVPEKNFIMGKLIIFAYAFLYFVVIIFLIPLIDAI